MHFNNWFNAYLTPRDIISISSDHVYLFFTFVIFQLNMVLRLAQHVSLYLLNNYSRYRDSDIWFPYETILLCHTSAVEAVLPKSRLYQTRKYWLLDFKFPRYKWIFDSLTRFFVCLFVFMMQLKNFFLKIACRLTCFSQQLVKSFSTTVFFYSIKKKKSIALKLNIQHNTTWFKIQSKWMPITPAARYE